MVNDILHFFMKVSASGELSAMRNTKPSITGLFAADVEPWSNATLACTLACNLIATCKPLFSYKSLANMLFFQPSLPTAYGKWSKKRYPPI